MKRTIVGAAVGAALLLTGLSAHASCVDPRSSSQQTAPFNFNQGSREAHFGQDAAGEHRGNLVCGLHDRRVPCRGGVCSVAQ